MVSVAFSTLGCPEMDLDTVLAVAQSYGFVGLELRAWPDQPVRVGLGPDERASIRRRLDAAGIAALSVASYVRVADPDLDTDAVVADALAHARLGADLGARYLRVFPGGPRNAPSSPEGDTRAAERLARIVTESRDLGVTVALETHDSHPRAADVARILDEPACTGVAVVWDVLHTWLAGERPDETLTRLAGRLAYVQVKDVAARHDLTPRPLGAGVLPLTDVAAVLRSAGFDGWVSWEYERAWYPEVPALSDLAADVKGWMDRELSRDSDD